MIIARAGHPVVRLVAVGAKTPPRVLGALSGQVQLPADFTAPLPEELLDACEALSINGSHAARARHLPYLHRDPFDRLLVAQAQIEPLTLMPDDPEIAPATT